MICAAHGHGSFWRWVTLGEVSATRFEAEFFEEIKRPLKMSLYESLDLNSTNVGCNRVTLH